MGLPRALAGRLRRQHVLAFAHRRRRLGRSPAAAGFPRKLADRAHVCPGRRPRPPCPAAACPWSLARLGATPPTSARAACVRPPFGWCVAPCVTGHVCAPRVQRKVPAAGAVGAGARWAPAAGGLAAWPLHAWSYPEVPRADGLAFVRRPALGETRVPSGPAAGKAARPEDRALLSGCAEVGAGGQQVTAAVRPAHLLGLGWALGT